MPRSIVMRYYRLWIYACNVVLLGSTIGFIVAASRMLLFSSDPRRYLIPGVPRVYDPTTIYAYFAVTVQLGLVQLLGCIAVRRLSVKLLNAYWLLLFALLFGDMIIGIAWIYRFERIRADLRPNLKLRLQSIKMKNFVIVVEEDNNKHVYPSKWLTDDRQNIRLPLNIRSGDLKDLIITISNPLDNWIPKPILKIVKYNDDYVQAIKERDIKGIEELSDPSDIEKVKSSRSLRNAKVSSDYKYDNPYKRIRTTASSSSTSGQKHDDNNTDKTKQNNIVIDTSEDEDPDKIEKSDSENLSQSTRNNELDFTNENCVDDKVIPGHSALNLPEVSINSSKNGSFNDVMKKLLQISENQGKILKVLHTFQLNQSNIDKKMAKLNPSASSIRSVNNPLREEVDQIIRRFIPVDGTEKPMEALESKLLQRSFTLSMIKYMQSIGGKDYSDMISNILATMVKDNVLLAYSYLGQKINKSTNQKNLCFKDLYLCKCLQEAITSRFPSVTHDDVKRSVSLWLDNAKTRIHRIRTNTGSRKVFEPLQLDALIDSENSD